jgi:hypothetical protein
MVDAGVRFYYLTPTTNQGDEVAVRAGRFQRRRRRCCFADHDASAAAR